MTNNRDDGYFEYTFPREDLAPGLYPTANGEPVKFTYTERAGPHVEGWDTAANAWRHPDGPLVYVDRFPPPERLRSIILASTAAGLCIGVALTIAAYSFGVLP